MNGWSSNERFTARRLPPSGDRTRVATPGTVPEMLRRLLVLVVVPLVTAGCGLATVETTGGTDDGKIDVARSAVLEGPTVPAPPPPSTSWSPNLDALGDDGASGEVADDGADRMVEERDSDSEPPTSTTIPPEPEPTSTTVVAPTAPPPAVAAEYHEVGHVVFAYAADLPLLLPVDRYEMIGFHESGHDGAFQLEVAGMDDWLTLASRGRGTGSRTAADIVVPVGAVVRSPVDGTVLRAGQYTLYCDHRDNFAVIEPTGRAGWEVKIFHFEGLAVSVGDTVVAAETVIGSSGRILPFESQVDEFTAEPSNPHLHVEVIDTSIPDRPSSGGGC